MPFIKHVDGTVVEVDDKLSKKLLDDDSNIWSSWSKKPAKKAAASKDSEDKE